MKHTPGPRFYTTTGDGINNKHTIESISRGLIATTPWTYEGKEHETEPNARLMSMAPKMLEVLQDVLKVIQRDEGGGQAYDSYVKNFGYDVENVIRKATGEE